MADWKEDNLACLTLWTTLYTMKQLFTNFSDSGDLKMSDLTYCNSLGSSGLIQQQATIIADQIDNIFRNGRGATYEKGVDRTKAIAGMVSVLTNGSKLVKDLALVADGLYHFWEETK